MSLVIRRSGMQKLSLIILIIFFSSKPAFTQEILMPDPSISPKRVIEIQLRALKQNDIPYPDFGIKQTWAFAHPKNRLITGPLERFAIMLKGPNYQLMLNHSQHTIKPVVLAEDYALFNVMIITATKHKASFQWEVSIVKSGNYRGSWMTSAVSPPMQFKDTI